MDGEDGSERRVVGLQYESGEGLPRVILKGSGKLAEEIIGKGKQSARPKIVQDEALVKALYRLPIDSDIGPELYEVVAILLVHVFSLDQQMKENSHE